MYTLRASDRTIGRAVDSPIGENLIAVGSARCADRTTQRDVPVSKNHIQPSRALRFLNAMKKNKGHIPRGRRVTDYAAAAMEQMELYCATHPGSPSELRRPRLAFRSELWIALLGPSIEEGIVGIGPTIEAALRAFDTQYLAGLRPPIEAVDTVGALRRPDAATRRSHRNLTSAPKSGVEVSSLVWPW